MTNSLANVTRPVKDAQRATRAFPPPPGTATTTATRAFPPALDSTTVRFGERVLSDTRAEVAPAARFDVDLRQRDALPAGLLASVRAEAEAAGYAAGWAEGRRAADVEAKAQAQRTAAEVADAGAAAAARVQRALGALAGAATQLERRVVPAACEIEDTIVAVAFEMATALLGRELSLSTEPGREALSRALALAPAARPVTVRLNPADRMTIGTSELVIEGRTVTLVDDPALAPGDAMAVCDATTIDARLAPALERVREALRS